MANTQSNLKEKVIKNLDISSYYRKYLEKLSELNDDGNAMALCPFHDDHAPSLSVNLENGKFKCFACDKSGSVFDFYRYKHGHKMDFKTALMDLAQQAGVLDKEKPSRIVEIYDYVDLNGNLIHQTVRYENKNFSQRRPDGKGGWIYLALEDTPRRLQSRIIDMLKGKGKASPENMFIYTEWPKMMKGGLRLLKKEISSIKNLRLIVIDTLKKFRPDNDVRKKNLYDIDYDDVDKIKKIADEFSVAILIIHHLRKMNSEDVMDTFSGTFGLTGAADSLLALVRKNGQPELHIVGRDIEESAYAMRFDKSTKTWCQLGRAEDIKTTNEQQRLYDTLKETYEPLSPKELSEITGLKIGYVKNRG